MFAVQAPGGIEPLLLGYMGRGRCHHKVAKLLMSTIPKLTRRMVGWGVSPAISPDDIPRGVTIGFSLWMLVWVPVTYWAYGPQNFLWLCNVAQFLILYGLWRRNRLLLSSQAGAVVLVGAIWTLDLCAGLISGGDLAVATAYMFDPELPLLPRIMSLYHTFVPLLLLWVLLRTGYDRRGPWLQSMIGIVVIMGSWLFAEPERNINWLHRPFGFEQVWLPEPVFVMLSIVLYPLLLYWPGHKLVLWLLRQLRRHTGLAG